MNQEMHMSSAWVIHFFCKLILSDFFNKWNRDEKQEMWMIIFFPERFPLWKKWTNAWKHHYSKSRVHFFFRKREFVIELCAGKVFCTKNCTLKIREAVKYYFFPLWGYQYTCRFKKVYLIEINALYCNDLALNQLSIILSSFYDKVNVYHLKA